MIFCQRIFSHKKVSFYLINEKSHAVDDILNNNILNEVKSYTTDTSPQKITTDISFYCEI